MESDLINSPAGLLRLKILSSSSLSRSLQDGSLGDSIFPSPMDAFEAGASAPLTALQRDCFAPSLESRMLRGGVRIHQCLVGGYC